MPRKSIQLIGSPGIVLDSPAHTLKDEAFSDALNMKFDDNGAESLVSDLSAFSTASVSPLWYQYFPPITAPKWAYADLVAVHAVDGTTHSDITRASGAYNAVVTERWQATVLNGIGILNNTIDVPQAWTDFDTSTLLVDLPNWTSTRRAKSIRAFKNFLVALYMIDSGTERPYRILWSDSADVGTVPGSWDSTDPATDSREFDLAETSDYLVDCLPMGDVNIVYKEDSTWGMQYIGPPFFFRFWKILSNRGLLHRDCVVSTPMGHVVATQDDIIVHAGQTEQSQSVLDRRLKRWLFSSIDPTNFKNSYMFNYPREKSVYFCFPEVGETYSNKAVIWNWGDQSIAVRDLVTTPFISVGPVGDSLIDDIEWGV